MPDRATEGPGPTSDTPTRRHERRPARSEAAMSRRGTDGDGEEPARNGDPRPPTGETRAASAGRGVPAPPGERGRPEHHPTFCESLDELMANVRRLARFAVETANLPPSVDIGALYRIQRKFELGETIDRHEFSLLVLAYQALERRLGPVSAETLRATEIVDPGRLDPDSAGWRPWRLLRVSPPLSAGDRYVRFLELRTFVNIGMVLVMHLIHWWSGVDSVSGATEGTVWYVAVLGLVAVYSIPFLYGALGADAYVLRETTHALHTREFDPRRIPENRSRFLLGALSGGMIILFVSQEVITGGMAGPFELGYAALGFIAGYSTDFLFNTIERLLGAILPRHRDDPRRRVRAEDRSHHADLERFAHPGAGEPGHDRRERSHPRGGGAAGGTDAG